MSPLQKGLFHRKVAKNTKKNKLSSSQILCDLCVFAVKFGFLQWSNPRPFLSFRGWW